jgi:hypothetical protein
MAPKRWDITPVGESLLAGARKGSDDDDLEKKLLKAFALQFGMGVANSFFKGKADQFANNEAVMGAKVRYRQAVANAETAKQRQLDIEKSQKSAEEYFAEQNKPIVIQGMSDARKEELYDPDAYNTYVNKLSRDMGIKQAAAHYQSLEQARSLGTFEEFSAGIQSKNTRPTNLMDFAIKGTTNFFKGKSQREIDQEAYESIRAQGLEASRMTALEEAFRKTNDLAGSYAYANDPTLFPDKETTKPIKSTDIRTSFSAEAGGVMVAKFVTEKDEDGNEVELQDERNVEFIPLTNLTADTDEGEAERVKVAVANFDFVKDAKELLPPEQFAMFQQQTLDQGIFTTNIKNMEQYATASELFANYMREAARLRDPTLEQKEIAYVAGLAESLNTISNLIVDAQSIKDPELKMARYEELIKEFNIISQAFKQVKDVPTEPPEIIDYSEFNP